MHLQKPKKLLKGDTIGIVSPASSPDDLSRINKGAAYFENLGYSVEVGKNVGKYYGYLAGSDEERIEDLHAMFANKNVKAIICVRGGYGSPRLLDKIDYRLIKKNPKIFVGYSDITALQLAFLRKANLVTFGGPMVAVDFHGEINQYTEENFWRTVTSVKKTGKVILPGNEQLQQITKGKAEGEITGGNLSLVLALLDTVFLPKMKNKILFLEDVDEAPYKIDRMLNQLSISGLLKKIAGLVLGEFTDCEEKDADKKTLPLQEVLQKHLGDLRCPVIKNFPHGHREANFTIPFGIRTKINADKGYVEFEEAAVI
ncbi:MAG: LD-carboxypeptidase [Ignavibacteria bacterium CG_4_8_14_3_um_filter_37_9]|nr:LD-carboxypeptidase [Ignavibacteria bacterium]OIO13885.1 MAG: LD-carboxypeptidase [Ignavibacteria bacterium CG1_02_37_35]PIP79738.1 MAG: LD-carboxypeptidase [Ignavibacteria bacterium CG22_combo_CG10-13_8_21_14_all_37_15]PIS45260.1 MAG: LD-carboxypeptidase [Ignavibacteria bacterium CG08_land_8_20_14_0_20_37_9]PIW99637.1 MAG: LD-carboxypeptidase [Ignavibacteria bacterium CG_4_8_14_3_um_filter_37_9]PIX94483.1 MAG: LD-carboxypeptidase [Ignavibacteria bacterium CG_4_10_14_3_um_filter_37_18]PJC5